MTEQSVVIVSGASRGIGFELVTYYLSKGFIVVGCSRGPSTVNDESYSHYCIDVSDELSVRKMIREVMRKYNKIDALVTCVGIAPAATLISATSSTLVKDVLHTNVLGTFNLCKEVSKQMVKAGGGRIVTFSSMAVGLKEPGMGIYASSKSSIVDLTKILAKEVADHGITCNVVAPSMYMTDAVHELGQEVIEKALSRLTLKRVLKIEEITQVIDFFLHPNSSAVTGQVIHLGLVC
jgi:3-oxoacyl-[acyl-carrier protein] reductase